MLEDLKQTLLATIHESRIDKVAIATLKPYSLNSSNSISKMNSMRLFLQQSLKLSENFGIIAEVAGLADDTSELSSNEANEVLSSIFSSLYDVLDGDSFQNIGFFQGLPISMAYFDDGPVEHIDIYLADTVDHGDIEDALLFSISKDANDEYEYAFPVATKSIVSNAATNVQVNLDAAVDAALTTSTDLITASELMSYSMSKNSIQTNHIHNILNVNNSGPLSTMIRSVITTVDTLSPIQMFQIIYQFINESMSHSEGNSYSIINLPGFTTNVLGVMVNVIADTISQVLSTITGWIGLAINALIGLLNVIRTGLLSRAGVTTDIADIMTLTPAWNMPLTPAFEFYITDAATRTQVIDIVNEFGLAAISVGNQLGAYYVVYSHEYDSNAGRTKFVGQLVVSGSTAKDFKPKVALYDLQPTVLESRYNSGYSDQYDASTDLNDPSEYRYTTLADQDLWRQLLCNLGYFLSYRTPLNFDSANMVYTPTSEISGITGGATIESLFEPVLSEPDYNTAKNMYQARWMYLAGATGSTAWNAPTGKWIELRKPDYEGLYKVLSDVRFCQFNKDIGIDILESVWYNFDFKTAFRSFIVGNPQVVPGMTVYEPALIYPTTSRNGFITALIITTATTVAIAGGLGLIRRAYVNRRRAKYSIEQSKRDAAAANYINDPTPANFNILSRAENRVSQQIRLCNKAGISPFGVDLSPTVLRYTPLKFSSYSGPINPDYTTLNDIKKLIKQ